MIPRITTTFKWNGVPWTRQRVANAVATAAQNIVAGAQQGIQAHGLVDTGYMLGSVHAEQQGPLEWWVVVGAEYAIYHEMGTVHLPARPFLGPAAQAEAPSYFGAVQRAVGA